MACFGKRKKNAKIQTQARQHDALGVTGPEPQVGCHPNSMPEPHVLSLHLRNSHLTTVRRGHDLDAAMATADVPEIPEQRDFARL